MLPENAHTRAVEGCCPDIRGLLPEHCFEAGFQLRSRFIGKGDREDAPAGDRRKAEQLREALFIGCSAAVRDLFEVVQVIGKKIVLYKPFKEKQKIILPK